MKRKIKKIYRAGEQKNNVKHEATSYDASKSETSTPQRVREINESSSEYAQVKKAEGK